MKASPLKGRKVKAETIAKRKATMEAKRALRSDPTNARDALAFLRKAVDLMNGKTAKELSDLELNVILAKRCLEGGLK